MALQKVIRNMLSTGVSDSSDSTAITIDSSENSTFAGNIVKGNLTISGTEIDLSSGDLTLDVAGDIILDADGADIRLKHAGTEWGRFVDNSNNLLILAPVADKDIMFNGVDGSSEITALTLDMSDAGQAIFNSGIQFGGGLTSPGGSNINIFSGSAINLGTNSSTRLMMLLMLH